MSEPIFDYLTMMLIDLKIVRIQLEDKTTGSGGPTDDQIARGIELYFSDCDSWESSVLDAAVAEYKRQQQYDESIRKSVDGLIGAMMGSIRRFS